MNVRLFLFIIGIFISTARVQLFAQGYGRPLTMQGVDAVTLHSAASRASGGLLFSVTDDVSLMFFNPASLQSLQAFQFSLGGMQSSLTYKQVQQYSPLKYYSNFSLLMEGLTRNIPNPVYDTTRTNYTAADTIQRPFDQLEPNWSRSENRTVPINVLAGTPISFGGLKIAIGAGVVEYTNLGWYYQNNNALSPSILTPNPYVPTRPANDADSNSIPIQWYQNVQQRTGAIQGYGVAVAATIIDHVTIGVSGMVLNGSSDDKETRVERGRLRLYQNYFRAESVYYRVSQIGTSEYSGQEFTFSGMYQGKFVTAGVALKLPTTIERTFKAAKRVDTTGSSLTTTVRGKDQIILPVRTTLALSIALRENLRFGFEYGLIPYASAEYTSPTGAVSTPWLSTNSARLGLEYQPTDWMAIRTGIRQQAEVFEPQGNPIAGEPVGYSVYSGGFGLTFSNLRFNATYEYSSMKYIDMWASAVSINAKITHAFMVDVSYSLPELF